MIATEQTDLLHQVRSLRGQSIEFDDLLTECQVLHRDGQTRLPDTEHLLKVQLSALVRAGLVTWTNGVIEAVPVAVEAERQKGLW